MAKRKQPNLTQYQVKTEAPSAFITAVPSFEWRQPWSTPPTRMGPISRMVGAALIAATGLFAPVFTPTDTAPDMDWLGPLSTPTPAKRGLPTHQQQTIAFTPENFPSCGLVGVDSEGTALVGGSSVTSIDYTGITVGGGQNRALVAMAQVSNTTGGMTAVWDQGGTNQNMTLIGTTSWFAETVAIFGLRNPVSGNNTLRFSWTAASFPVVTAVSLITVDQSSDANAFKNYQFNRDSGVSTLSVTVPSKPGDIVVGIGGAPGAITVSSVGDNNIYVDNTSSNHSGAGWNVGAASVTFTGTSDLTSNWLIGAIDVSAFPCPVDTDFILPLSEVPRQKAALHPSLQDASTPDVFQTTEIITVDKWFDALSGPILARRGLNDALQVAYTTEYFPDTPNANAGLWLGSFAEPLRVKSRFSALQAVFTIGYSPETIGQWFNPLSEPARIKRSLTAPDQSWVPFVTTETVTVDKWFDAFSEPVRVKSRFSATQQAYTSGYAVFEVVTIDKWFDQLSEPVRTRPALRAALQPVATQDAKLETVTVDKWYAELSDPKRFKPALHVSLQQTITQDTIFIPSPSQYMEGWYGWLAEPVRQKAGLTAAQQSTTVWPLTTAEVVTVDKWFEQLSDPTRLKPGDRDRYSGENEWTAIAASMKWFSPLTEPVRQKIGLSANQQQTLAYAVSFTAEVVSVDKWFVSYSEPVRFKRGQRPELQQVSAQDPRYIPDPASFIEGWFKSYAEPIRVPARLVTAAQQAFFYGTLQAEIRFDYYNWLTEPVRQKKGLGAHLQRPLTQDLKLFPNPARFLEGWYNWYSEPVRKLPQLNAALQQSWIGPDRRPVLATITVTIAATEINNDVPLFAVMVLPYNPPATAVVSLVEIGHGASLTSIVEEGDDGSGTSIVES